MKKKLVSLLLCGIMAASALTFTGCGNNSNADQNTPATTTEASAEPEADVSATAEAEKEATNLPSESGITSVSEFLATDEMKAAYDELKSSLNDQGLDFKLEGTDNTLTYIYAYRETNIDKKATAAALADAKDSTVNDLKTAYDSLKEAGITDPVVEARFLAADGDVIYSVSYPEK